MADSPISLTPQITFALFEPQAQHVSLSGDFNSWTTEGTPLSRQDDGLWSTRLALPPGRYEYKFVVDGQWLPDPTAQENIYNAHGTLNSVVVVRD
jgi:1,4-alpha-glucan branching enzyme